MERLSGRAAGFLTGETAAAPLHVCTLVELAPAPSPDQPEHAAGYSFDSVRDSLRELVGTEPVLRRKLFDNFFNLDHPAWVDDRQFDIDRHLHRVAVPAPGHDAELAQLVGHLAGQPLDRGRPLWEVWVIEGRSNGSVAVLAKTHITGDYADIWLKEIGVPKERYEFQVLLGVREELWSRWKGAGHTVRVYVPYGPDWRAYSLRRMRKNPQIVGHVLRQTFGMS